MQDLKKVQDGFDFGNEKKLKLHFTCMPIPTIPAKFDIHQRLI